MDDKIDGERKRRKRLKDVYGAASDKRNVENCN
jgi:hypothetical protein